MTDKLVEIKNELKRNPLRPLTLTSAKWLIGEVENLRREVGTRRHYGHQVTNNLNGTMTCSDDGQTFEDWPTSDG